MTFEEKNLIFTNEERDYLNRNGVDSSLDDVIKRVQFALMSYTIGQVNTEMVDFLYSLNEKLLTLNEESWKSILLLLPFENIYDESEEESIREY